MKKLFIISIVAVFMCSSAVYARGGRGNGGSLAGGTAAQTRIHSRDGSGTGTGGVNAGGSGARTRAKKQDGTCTVTQ